MVPDFTEGNPYQKLLKENLFKEQIHVKLDKYPMTYFPFSTLFKQHPEASVLHIHWLSPLMHILSWTANSRKAKLRCILIALDCLWLRLRNKKIVWTIHNKFAHENFDRDVELFLRRLLCLSVSSIIVHSQTALSILTELYQLPRLNKRANVIFHGNYAGVYPAPDTCKQTLLAELALSEDSIVVLCFGMVRPYKGLEHMAQSIIDNHIPENIHFVIAGKADDQAYANQLSSLCKQSSQLHLKLGFLTDQALSNWLAATDIVAVPFTDTLTSGSVILSMTQGKALLLPEVSRVFDCVDDNGAIFYKDSEDMIKKLRKLTRNKVDEMGRNNQNTAENMNWQTVARKTAAIYNQE